MRTESDFLGSIEVPEEALYGIHSFRARQNFPDNAPFPPEWYRATGLVKKACYLTYVLFKKTATGKVPDKKDQFLEEEILQAMISAAGEISEGRWFDQLIIPAITGGAGTSINMNVNEIIANLALILLGEKPGTYNKIDPVEQANVFQSTNDVIPTALKVSLMFLLKDLEGRINDLRAGIEQKERLHSHDLRTAYTQMQQAVPSSFGKLFSAYNDALSRDWWRISKCMERLKEVNLGGGAIGTGLGIPRYFIMEVVSVLARETGLTLARSENMTDTTSNLDAFVEVHAILKAHAVNLEKMVSDLRLLSSDIIEKQELKIPARQVGSSIMPGKVNPVIPEFVISAAHQVYANDQLVSGLAGQGCLELNAYLPVIGCAMIRSLNLLIAADETLLKNLVADMEILSATGADKLWHSPSVTTALVPLIGYHKSTQLAKYMKETGAGIFEANDHLNLLPKADLERLMQPGNLLSLGYRLSDI
ncbi:MAG: lyase family protein [Syntrophothermus sp.]